MTHWIQNYSALANNIFLTALCAILPFLLLFWALAVKKMKGCSAVFLAWLGTAAVSLAVYKMPLGAVLSAAGYGAIQGIFPLCWLVFNAVFLFNLIVKSGNFEIIISSVSSVSGDRRVQAILIAFCFSAFLEGTTSQGAPVAIAASMLIGMGFPVLKAALVCLVGNTVPVPFGSAGTPLITTVTTAFGGNPDAMQAVTASVGGVMCIYALLIPFFMTAVMCGLKAARGVIPLCLAAGITYIVPNFLITRYIGPELPSLLSPLLSLVMLVVFLRFWKPKTVWRFENDSGTAPDGVSSCGAGKIIRAWMPFILVTTLMIVWSLPAFKAFSARLPFKIAGVPWPSLHGIVYLGTPVVNEPALYTAIFGFDFFGAAGTGLLIVSGFTVIFFKMRISVFWKVLAVTFNQLKFALLSMILVLSAAQLSNYSGISYTLGLAFSATGPLFMIFSPFIGFIGVFLTGSVTSSGALFGSLQAVSAEQLGLNPLVTVTASMAGAVMGKLVSPQSIAIGAAAAGLVGRESSILKETSKYAFVLLAFGIVTMLILAYFFPAYFPSIAG